MTLLSRILLLTCLLGGGVLQAEQLAVEARRGDGIYSLLRRYNLVAYGCNIDEFKRLNRLNSNSKLMVGYRYELPIEVFQYDGKSIRSTTGNDNWDRAVAIKEYNEDLLAAGLRESDYRDDRVLWVPYHIDHCSGNLGFTKTEPDIVNLGENAGSEEELERLKDRAADRDPIAVPEQVTRSGPRTFKIFGDTYAEVPLIDRSLAGRIFYIVAGHGGPDPGAVGRRGDHLLAEDEYAYDVALRLCRNILQHGGTPYMIIRDENDGIRDDEYLTPDSDETVWGGASLPRSQKARLFQRSDIINALYDENLAKGIVDQTMIAIHIDSRHRGQRIDVFLYYPEGDLRGAHRAEQIQRTFSAKYDQYRPGRGYEGSVSERDLHMLRETKPSGVYIELANIANSSDQQRIINPRNRQLLADWLLMGLYD
ncbi:N-acetylmuramoyl-L-alanine amidase [Lewinella marina]|uniref:N-acetylmuramoyl-L-alanine amidase n=1 Tax=Neolewinella marina TaxID=438751 RepID=A0A2G0CII5_9BACT|nr:N-acetylmuramoyl-L-alanine amidase [Neolewinella marina]NJB85074.1 N-acetylmuramoyl-L-alanine amidase [Neolewinella marina]PHK99785.1 cell wall hydrolase [Neolewinella marina]